MDIRSRSRSAQVAYQDLLRLHQDEAASSFSAESKRHRNGRVYPYNKFRIGTEMESRY